MSHRTHKPQLIILTGPTACGKTALAHSLAKSGDLLINADSRQLYKGFKAGVAKPKLPEDAPFSYDLLENQPLEKKFTAYDFIHHVAAVTEQRKKNPLPKRIFIVGGTLFYINALEEGLPQLPVPESTKQTLQNEYRQYGLARLLAELQRTDPEHHAHVDQSNPRRVIRALELIRTYHKPFTLLKTQRSKSTYALLKIILIPPKTILWQSIEQRVHDMFVKDAIINEVRSLLASGVTETVFLQHKAIGYLETSEFLNGFISREQAIAQTILRSQHLAKRQMNWLKKQQHAKFIFIGKHEDFSYTQTPVAKRLPHSKWNFPPRTFHPSNEHFYVHEQKTLVPLVKKLCIIFEK